MKESRQCGETNWILRLYSVRTHTHTLTIDYVLRLPLSLAITDVYTPFLPSLLYLHVLIGTFTTTTDCDYTHIASETDPSNHSLAPWTGKVWETSLVIATSTATVTVTAKLSPLIRIPCPPSILLIGLLGLFNTLPHCHRSALSLPTVT